MERDKLTLVDKAILTLVVVGLIFLTFILSRAAMAG